MKDIYETLTGRTSNSVGSLERGERGELLKALRAEDIRRRLAEAEILIRENRK
jgi:hypothetical protein